MSTREEILATRPARSTGHLALVLAFLDCDFAAAQTALDSHDIDLNCQSLHVALRTMDYSSYKRL